MSNIFWSLKLHFSWLKWKTSSSHIKIKASSSSLPWIRHIVFTHHFQFIYQLPKTYLKKSHSPNICICISMCGFKVLDAGYWVIIIMEISVDTKCLHSKMYIIYAICWICVSACELWVCLAYTMCQMLCSYNKWKKKIVISIHGSMDNGYR